MSKMERDEATHEQNVEQVAKTTPVAASPGEQDPADAAKKLQAALSAINHLAQDFHERGVIRCPCMGGVIGTHCPRHCLCYVMFECVQPCVRRVLH